MMKKTLVALAATAVAGGAFAQATLTGTIAYAYSQKTLSSGATTGGLGLDTSALNFAIAEEIEGMGKLTAGFGISAGDKDAATYGRDSFLKLDMGGMGSVKWDNVYAASWLAGAVASPGSVAYCGFSKGDCASGVGMFSTFGYQDDLQYALKLSDAVSISATHTQPSTGAGGGSAAGSQYIYSGGTGTAQRYNTYSATYASGPLTITGGYRTYDGADQSTKNSNYRHRAAASFDMGVAKIGGGYEATATTYGDVTTDTVVGVSVPAGALTLSAQFGNRTISGSSTTTSDTSYSGSIYGAKYALSKRTSLDATYINTQNSGTSNASYFLTRLAHTF